MKETAQVRVPMGANWGNLAPLIRDFAGTPRFEILRRLGAGGMGVVYEALDRERGVRVALKRLHSFSPEALLQLKAEFRSLRDVSHPNLVSLGELVEEAGHWFFTMELVEGRRFLSYVRSAPSRAGDVDAAPGQTSIDLEPTAIRAVEVDRDEVATRKIAHELAPLASPARRRKVLFDEPRLRDAFAQLVSALVALHAAGKVHRDIKPSNVLVTKEGRAVLLDFGLVMKAERQGATGDMPSTVIGTPEYMAPEQFTSSRVGPSADLYSLGVLLYEALVGERPGRASSRRLPPVPPSVLAPVPEDLSRLAMELLDLDAEHRPSAKDVLERLGAARKLRAFAVGQVEPAPFIGRNRELYTLRDALERAAAGSGTFVIVQGQSGVGKTSLVRELIESAGLQGPGLEVLEGSCHDRESVPFNAFDGVIDGLATRLKEMPEQEREDLLPLEAPLLAKLFPVLGQVPPLAGQTLPSARHLDAQEVRARAFAALRALLEGLARRRPVLLALDDLQWADPDSLALLRELIQEPMPPMLLLATVRTSSEQPWRPAQPEGAPSFLGENPSHLVLRALTQEHARTLAKHLLGGEDEESLTPRAARIAHESGGHPMFIAELARHSHEHPGAHPVSALQLDDALWCRIQALPDTERELLAAVSLAGTALSNEALQRLSGLKPERYASATAQLRSQQLLRPLGLRRKDRVEPFHDRIRETVAARIGADLRRSLHVRLAETLEITGEADAEVLAYHWLGAGRAEQARHYVDVAARQAAGSLAFERAARLLTWALELTAEPETARRRRYWADLGEVLASAGRGEASARAFLKAADTGALEPEAVELRRRAGDQFLRAGHFEEGTSTLLTSLEAAGMPLPKSMKAKYLSLAYERARLALRGLDFELKDSSALPLRTSRTLDTAWTTVLGLAFVDPAIGLLYSTRHLMLALDAGDPDRILRGAMTEYGFFAAFRGLDAPITRKCLAIAEELLAKREQPYMRAFYYQQRAIALFNHGGHYGQVWRFAYDAERIFESQCSGVIWELTQSRKYVNATLYYLGDWAELAVRAKRFQREARERGDVFGESNATSAGSIVSWLLDDDSDEAERVLSEAMSHWTREHFYVAHYFELFGLTQLHLYRGDAQTLRERYDRDWPRMRRAGLLRFPIVKYSMVEARARTYLACAEAASGAERDVLTRRVQDDIRQLDALEFSGASASARMLEAGLFGLQGNEDAAIERLRLAERQFAADGMRAMQMIARSRRGQLMGGDAGRVLLGEGIGFCRAQGGLRPARLIAMNAPGFQRYD